MKPSSPSHDGARAAWLGLAARLLIGAVLIVSGASKLSTPTEEFAVVVEAYDLVSVDAAQTVAALLPWAELVVGFSVLLGCMTPMAGAGAGLMFASFIFAILSTKARGFRLPDCGCFGGRFHIPPMAMAALDAVLLVACVLVYLHGRRKLSLDNWAEQGYTGRA